MRYLIIAATHRQGVEKMKEMGISPARAKIALTEQDLSSVIPGGDLEIIEVGGPLRSHHRLRIIKTMSKMGRTA